VSLLAGGQAGRQLQAKARQAAGSAHPGVHRAPGPPVLGLSQPAGGRATVVTLLNLGIYLIQRGRNASTRGVSAERGLWTCNWLQSGKWRQDAEPPALNPPRGGNFQEKSFGKSPLGRVLQEGLPYMQDFQTPKLAETRGIP
jgi:hypothetical protein